MDEHCHSMMDDNSQEMISVGMDGYTCDLFVCGLCGEKTSDIECYVSHMMLTEKCVLHLCPSTAISNLLLPRFSKKQKRVKGEEVDIKHPNDLIAIVSRGGLDGADADMKEILPASEVETGEERRWKCHHCGLTFSRQAAVLNHFKLQHSESNTPEEKTEDLPESHIKKESAVDAPAPVKHVLAVESKPNVQTTASLDDAWSKLACPVCGQTFKTSKIVRAHVATVHSGSRPFPCDYKGCPYSFKTKGSLKRHHRRHTGERPFVCPDCGRHFRESGALVRHQKARVTCVNKTDAQMPRYGTSLPLTSHLPPDRKPAVNDPKLSIQLKQELISSHTDEARGWTPEEAKAPLKEVQGPASVKTEPPHPPHPPSTTQLVPCKIEIPPAPLSPLEGDDDDVDDAVEMSEMNDDKDFKPPRPPLLPDIIRRSFTCPVCAQVYTRRSTLSTHMKLHLEHLGNQCGECGRGFSSRAALCRHLSSHSSVRQYECALCNKAFKLPSHATTHLATHTHTTPIPCRHCGRLYKTKSARNTHERTHTSSPSFSCVECHRSFTTKASLVRHLRTHTGETPFTCPYCGRGFKEHGTLSRHLKHKMPCARQAKLEAATGDVGIRLDPGGGGGRKVKEEAAGHEYHLSPQPEGDAHSDVEWTPLRSSPTPSSSMGCSSYDLDINDLPSPNAPASSSDQELAEGRLTEGRCMPGDHTLAEEEDEPSYIIITGADHSNLNGFDVIPLVSER